MGAEKKTISSALRRLTPNAVDIKIDGQDLRVPVDKSENSVMSMILAAQMRNLMQDTIKKYKDDDVKLMPKELADLAKAARDIAAFAAEVYAGTEGLDPNPGVKKESAPDESIPDFNSMKKAEPSNPAT